MTGNGAHRNCRPVVRRFQFLMTARGGSFATDVSYRSWGCETHLSMGRIRRKCARSELRFFVFRMFLLPTPFAFDGQAVHAQQPTALQEVISFFAGSPDTLFFVSLKHLLHVNVTWWVRAVNLGYRILAVARAALLRCALQKHCVRLCSFSRELFTAEFKETRHAPVKRADLATRLSKCSLQITVFQRKISEFWENLWKLHQILLFLNLFWKLSSNFQKNAAFWENPEKHW